MRSRIRCHVIVWLIALALPGLARAQNTITVRARLLSPLSTRHNRANDKFTLQVLSPVNLKDGIIEGHVIKAKGSGKVKGKSQLLLAFDTITIHGRTTHIKADLHSVKNSKGVDKVDEEGNVIGKGSRTRDFLLGLALAGGGAAAGAAAGGQRGAITGAAIGAGIAAAIVLSTRGPEISFAAGSEFTINLVPTNAP